jgi:hypothetical protein
LCGCSLKYYSKIIVFKYSTDFNLPTAAFVVVANPAVVTVFVVVMA